MLQAYLASQEPNAFKEGLNRYLTDHAFGFAWLYLQLMKLIHLRNAETEDLWEALAEDSGDDDIDQMMDSWTTQKGFPYITLVYDPNSNLITATQVLPKSPVSSSDDGLCRDSSCSWEILHQKLFGMFPFSSNLRLDPSKTFP